MRRIYKNQSALRIKVRTFTDLENVENTVIRYRKPDGTKGEFPAAVIDVENGVIIHEVIEGEIDKSGWWAFWAFVTFADGRTAAGEASKVFIWNEGR